MSDQPKKKMGRPKKYSDRDGAPALNIRMDPFLYEIVRCRPEGARAYIERLVSEDVAKCGEPLIQAEPASNGSNGESRS